MKILKLLAVFLMVIIPIGGHGQTLDYNLFEQGPLDTLETGSLTLVSDTLWFKGGQRGGMTIRGHATKLSGDDKTLTLKAILFFDASDFTDVSDEKTIASISVTTTELKYSYSLPNYNFWGVARGIAIIYEIVTGGTNPAIEIKGKALIR